MQLKDNIQKELEKGFSKVQLEKLIGLPQNFLSGYLKGKKNLSKKCEIKVQRFLSSEIPDPLKPFIDKNGKQTSVVTGKSVVVDIKPENYHQESQNKPHTDTKKENVGETIPEVDYSAHNAEIQKQINAVTLENKPSWLSKDKFERYQTKKIAELQLKLK